MKFKKSLGQHFLRSERALAKIIEAGNLNQDDLVLEIGPGEGVLTELLLNAAGKVLAVEKDDQLFESLKAKFNEEISSGKLVLTNEDILDFDLLALPKKYKLIANIPYNITGAILEKFLSSEYQPDKIVLLVQKEVAKRTVAQDQKESILSISVKAYGKPRYVETVKAGSFVPAPKVDSAIIAIENISKGFFQNFPEKTFFDLLHAGFRSKRKKLSSNLAVIFEKEEVREAFQKLGLDENLRAEDVPVETWRKLTALILKH